MTDPLPSKEWMDRWAALQLANESTQSTAASTLVCELVAEIQRLERPRLSTKLGELLISRGYFDRMKDLTPEDTAERVVTEFLTLAKPIVSAHYGRTTEPLSEYLKDGESVTQCIQRNRDDVSKALGLLAKAQRDALRYRWLRTNIHPGVQVLFEDEQSRTFDYNDDYFDEAVDALMVKSPQGECPTGDYEQAGVVAPKGNASESPASTPPPGDGQG